MSDRQIALLAALVWVGALLPVVAPFIFVVIISAGAVLTLRRRWALRFIFAMALLASVLAGRAWAGIEPAVERRFEGFVELSGDPEPVRGGVRVTATIDGERYDLRAWGSPAGGIRKRLMGEQVHVQATLRPLRDAPTWLLAQGLTGRGTITSVAGFDVGSPHTRLANSIRRTIESGAASMTREDRALFTGRRPSTECTYLAQLRCRRAHSSTRCFWAECGVCFGDHWPGTTATGLSAAVCVRAGGVGVIRDRDTV